MKKKKQNENFDAEGCNRLCAAAVVQAAKDYKRALRRVYLHPHDVDAQHMVNDCERFFQNEMSMYSTLDGASIMRKIREMVKEGLK